MERCFARFVFVINCVAVSGGSIASQELIEDSVDLQGLSRGDYSLAQPELSKWERDHEANTAQTKRRSTKEALEQNTGFFNGIQIKAGGGGGNEKLGLTCFSPEIEQMSSCLEYVHDTENVSYAQNGSQILFADFNDNAIFADFDGYPFIVTQVGDTCYLENDYVTTIKYAVNTSNDTAYGYDCRDSAEHFVVDEVDTTYYDFFSFTPENDAHFYGGVVMQMFHRYLDDLFPDQKAQNVNSPDCPTNDQGEPNADYCLKRLLQRAHALGITGGHMDDANWDGEYVNYGNGQYGWRFYSLTTIDIVAHEAMHALSEWNGGLNATGQSGAIGEGLGDIAAIAANHYLDQHLVGDQDDNYKTSVGYLGKRDNNWSYAWDSYVYDELMRIFELPSFDGRSIDDARDHQTGKDKHHSGGVLRKLYYELVVSDGWTHEQAFKLFLRANVSCFTPSVTFDQMGTCLLSQVDNILTTNIDAMKDKLDERLHRLGIFADNSQITPLIFTQNKHYDHAEYWISPIIDVTDIDEVNVDWGDGTQVHWSANDNNGVNIEDVLTGEHLYSLDAGHVSFSLSVLKNDGTLLQGLSQDYIHSSSLLCTPIVHNPNGEISQFTFMGQTHTMPNAGYQYVDASHLTLPSNNPTPIIIEGNFTGKILSVFADMNRDGYFNRDELIATEESMIDGTITLTDLDKIDAGKILLRVVVNDYTSSGCGDVSKGMAFDILTTLEASSVPPTAEFSYQITGTTNVQFNAVTKALDYSH